MKKLTIIVFLFISVAFGYFQNGNGLIYNPGDSNYSANPKLDYFRSASVIDWKQSFGIEESLSIAKNFPYNFLLNAISIFNITISNTELILFSVIIFLGLFGIYKLFEIKNEYIKIILSILYIFNPYSITLVLGGSNFMPLFMVIGLPYLIKSYFILYQKNNIHGYIYLITGLLITKASLTNPMYGLPYLLFLFSAIILNPDKKNFKIIFLISIVAITFYSDLIAGLILNIAASKNALLKSTIDLNILYFVPGGSKLFNSLSLLPHWGFFGSYSGEPYYTYASIFEEIRYVDISGALSVLLIIIFIIHGLRFDYKAKIYLLYFLLSLFFVVGSNFPTGRLYNYFIQFSGLSYPLRESHDKATAGLALATILIISYFFSIEKLKKYKWVGYTKITLLCLFAVVAISSGNFFRDKGVLLGGTRYKLPDNYYRISSYIKSEELLRILVLPPQWISVPGIQSMIIGGFFYTGPDPLDRMTDSQFIYPTRFGYNFINNFQEEIFYKLMRHDKVLDTSNLKVNGIDGVLIRKDFTSITYRYNSDSYEYMKLITNKSYSKIYEDEIFILFRLNE